MLRVQVSRKNIQTISPDNLPQVSKCIYLKHVIGERFGGFYIFKDVKWTPLVHFYKQSQKKGKKGYESNSWGVKLQARRTYCVTGN